MIGTEGKQAAKTRRNREAILNAAIYLTRNYGADALTVKNICDTAGVSNGSFYHLFSGKDDLVYYYLSYAFQKYRDTMMVDTIGLSASGCIKRLYSSYLDVCLDVGYEFISIVYSPTNKSLNYFERPKEQSLILDEVTSCLRRGVQTGEFKPNLDIDEAVLGVASIVTGLIFYWCVFEGRHIDLKEQAGIMLDAYLRTIEA